MVGKPLIEWTEETSWMVVKLCMARCSVEQIAMVVKLSVPMLKRFYKFELSSGDAVKNADVVDKLYQAAIAGEKWAIALWVEKKLAWGVGVEKGGSGKDVVPSGPVLNVTIQEVRGREPGKVIEITPDKSKPPSQARIGSR